MSEIVKTDTPQPVCIQQLRKLLRHIMRFNEVSHLIDTDITGILLVVRPSAQSAIIFLLFLQDKKTFLHERNQRECPQARFCLCCICRDELYLSVQCYGCYGVADRDGIIFKVDGMSLLTLGKRQGAASSSGNCSIVLSPDSESPANAHSMESFQ